MKTALFFLLSKLLTQELYANPKWINDPYAVCLKMREVCSVGVATGPMAALENGRNELAKFFQTKISSQQVFNKEVRQGAQLLDHDVFETASIEIEESTEEILNGVKVLKRFQDESYAYALVSLNRKLTKKILAAKINQIDEKMKGLIQEGKAHSLHRLKRLYLRRSSLAQKHLVIAEKELKSVYTWTDIMALKKNRKGSRVKLDLPKNRFHPNYLSYLKSILSEDGYKFSHESYDYHLKGRSSFDELYFNVEGFKKFRFDMNLLALNNEGVEVGSLNLSLTKIGRNKKDAQNRVLKEMHQEIREKIEKLNLN